MEVQYQILVYFASVLMVVIALRFFLKFIRDVVIRAGDKWIRDIFVALSAVVFSVFIGIPYWGMDVTIPYEWGAVTTVLVSFVVLAVFFHIRSSPGNDSASGKEAHCGNCRCHNYYRAPALQPGGFHLL